MNYYFNFIKNFFPLIEAIFLSLLLGLIANYVIFKVIRKYYHPYKPTPFNVALSAIRTAAYIIFPLIFFSFCASLLDLSKTLYFIESAVRISITIALSLSAIKLLNYIDVWLAYKKKLSDDSLDLGMLITRTYLIKKILKTVIAALMIALILLNFPTVKEIGKGILISASVIGGMLAFAAQRIFTNFFSGIDVIFNKPIKIGDSITIADESGTIENITLNQIYLRTWDLRLVVYPLSYFIDNPFQNLSHSEQGLRGTVFLYADYKVDMENLRHMLTNILQDSPLWDKKSNALQMVEVTEQTIQLRAVISAKNSNDLWNLRCYVREKMVAFIQSHCPEITPKQRIAWDQPLHDNAKVEKQLASLHT